MNTKPHPNHDGVVVAGAAPYRITLHGVEIRHILNGLELAESIAHVWRETDDLSVLGSINQTTAILPPANLLRARDGLRELAAVLERLAELRDKGEQCPRCGADERAGCYCALEAGR